MHTRILSLKFCLLPLIGGGKTTNTKTIGGGGGAGGRAGGGFALRERTESAPPFLISHEPQPGVVPVLGRRLVRGSELRPGRHRQRRRSKVHAAHAAGRVGAEEYLHNITINNFKGIWSQYFLKCPAFKGTHARDFIVRFSYFFGIIQ
jgi:hypothetical protein